MSTQGSSHLGIRKESQKPKQILAHRRVGWESFVSLRQSGRAGLGTVWRKQLPPLASRGEAGTVLGRIAVPVSQTKGAGEGRLAQGLEARVTRSPWPVGDHAGSHRLT